MDYGDIIKRAWKITWRYRALWVLGLFAGVAGGSAGGGNSGYNSGTNSSDFAPLSDAFGSVRWTDLISRFLPVLIAGFLILFVAGLVLTILRISAQGGLVHAVSELEQGRPFTLSTAWGAGFGHFWRILGLSIVLGLPLAVVALGLTLAVVVPIVLPLVQGGALEPASFGPLCGAAVIGLPILIVGGIILGVMHELGLRFIMLDNVGVFDAAGSAWRMFRTRIKDSLIMWFINIGLNIAAGAALAIPLLVVFVAATVPAVIWASSGSYGALISIGGIVVLIAIVLVAIWTAIWATFTSSLWTVFFRRLTGREVLPEMVAPQFAPPPPPSPAPPAVPDASPLAPPTSTVTPEGTAS